MAHFSVKQRKPLRKSFMPSRRQSRQTASRCLANSLFSFEALRPSVAGILLSCAARNPYSNLLISPLHAAALGRAATIVRDGSHVLDRVDVQAGGSQGANSGFATRTGPLDANFDRLHAVLIASGTGGVHGGLLRGVGRAFARTFKAHRTGGGPAYGAAVGIGEGNDGVVESGLNTDHEIGRASCRER